MENPKINKNNIAMNLKIKKFIKSLDFGFNIGVLSVLASVSVSIFCIIIIKDINNSNSGSFWGSIQQFIKEIYKNDIDTLITEYADALACSLLMILFSVLLIMGITKERHNLMLPWLIVCCFVYKASIIKFLEFFIVMIATGYHWGFILMFVFFVGPIIAPVTSTLWRICGLYKIMRNIKADTKGDVTTTSQAVNHNASTADTPSITIQK